MPYEPLSKDPGDDSEPNLVGTAYGYDASVLYVLWYCFSQGVVQGRGLAFCPAVRCSRMIVTILEPDRLKRSILATLFIIGTQ